jgi:hypothetical protein
MQRILLFLGLILGLSYQSLHAQAVPAWQANGLSLHVGTNLFVIPVVASYERYVHREKVHWGFGTGLTWAPATGRGYGLNLGGQLTVSMWTGQGKHHFEAKTGLVAGHFEGDFFETNVLPVLTLGYRLQKPGEPFFFRADLGVGGIGVGLGTTF